MRVRGINYDTGTRPGGRSTRERFDHEVVRREMRVIAEDLHCTAVRVSGDDAERLAVAARYAADAGLEVWFAPFPCDLTPAEMLPLFDACAGHAEDLRRGGAEVVFVTGGELSLFGAGFLPGDDAYARINAVKSGDPVVAAAFEEAIRRFGVFLREAHPLRKFTHNPHAGLHVLFAFRLAKVMAQQRKNQHMGVAQVLERLLQHARHGAIRFVQVLNRLDRAQGVFVDGIAVEILITHDAAHGRELGQVRAEQAAGGHLA